MTNYIPRGLFIPILIYHHLTWLISAESSAPGNAPHLIPQGKKATLQDFFSATVHKTGPISRAAGTGSAGSCPRWGPAWEIKWGSDGGSGRTSLCSAGFLCLSLPSPCLVRADPPSCSPFLRCLLTPSPLAEPSLWGWFLVVQLWQHRELRIMEQEWGFPWEGVEWDYSCGSFPSWAGLIRLPHPWCLLHSCRKSSLLAFPQFLISSTGPTAPLELPLV